MAKLAIFGGAPAITHEEIQEVWPIITEEEIQAVTDVLRRGNVSWINDTEVPALEAEWAEFQGTKYALALNSGTAALHAAVAAAGVGPGDEVIVPALTFLASASAVIHHQGVPVFVDVDPRTFTMDPAQIEAAISPRTKAIIVVHLHGLPADMASIMAIAQKHGLYVIEDTAQAQGALYQGKKAGSIGHMGAYSIMAGKNLATAGEGGLFTTNDPALRNSADMVKMFGEKVVPGEPRAYNALTMGWNYRFSSILAAFTRVQLRKLPGFTEQVQANATYLAHHLAEIPGLIPPYVPADRTHVYHHFRFRVDPAAAGLDLPVGVLRKALQDVMAAEGLALIEYQNRPVPGQALFQERIGYGGGCPWSCHLTSRPVSYDWRQYTATLDVIRSTLLVGHRLCMASMLDRANVDRIILAFQKVFDAKDELLRYARSIEYHEPWEEGSRLW